MNRAAAIKRQQTSEAAIGGRITRGPTIQRNCAACGSGKSEEDQLPLRRTPVAAGTSAPASSFAARLGAEPSGAPLPASARTFFEPRFARDLGHVRLHDDASAGRLAREINARAFTFGSHVYFARGQHNPASAEGRRLLAHELAHTFQQATPMQMLQREPDQPEGAQTQRPRSPREEMLVQQAQERLKLLHQFVSEWTVREARRTHIAQEREPMLAKRKAMDTDAESQSRGEIERRRVPSINKGALRIEITDDAVVFNIAFHVVFEERKMADRFGELRDNLGRAVVKSWNQSLLGPVFIGREFRIRPDVVLAKPRAARDRSRWLITVRPNDTDQPTYPGCAFAEVSEGPATSVTLAECDGGVMSIPPRHIGLPDVLAHELLHLFGLYDRYIMLEAKVAEGAPTTEVDTIAMRETHGRKDPLGAEEGKVLSEDIAFLFDRLGVYEIVESRGLEVLRGLERSGMTIAQVRGEIHRQEEILRTGRDPSSLIRERRDFTREMIKSAEDIE